MEPSSPSAIGPSILNYSILSEEPLQRVHSMESGQILALQESWWEDFQNSIHQNNLKDNYLDNIHSILLAEMNDKQQNFLMFFLEKCQENNGFNKDTIFNSSISLNFFNKLVINLFDFFIIVERLSEIDDKKNNILHYFFKLPFSVLIHDFLPPKNLFLFLSPHLMDLFHNSNNEEKFPLDNFFNNFITYIRSLDEKEIDEKIKLLVINSAIEKVEIFIRSLIQELCKSAFNSTQRFLLSTDCEKAMREIPSLKSLVNGIQSYICPPPSFSKKSFFTDLHQRAIWNFVKNGINASGLTEEAFKNVLLERLGSFKVNERNSHGQILLMYVLNNLSLHINFWNSRSSLAYLLQNLYRSLSTNQINNEIDDEKNTILHSLMQVSFYVLISEFLDPASSIHFPFPIISDYLVGYRNNKGEDVTSLFITKLLDNIEATLTFSVSIFRSQPHQPNRYVINTIFFIQWLKSKGGTVSQKVSERLKNLDLCQLKVYLHKIIEEARQIPVARPEENNFLDVTQSVPNLVSATLPVSVDKQKQQVESFPHEDYYLIKHFNQYDSKTKKEIFSLYKELVITLEHLWKNRQLHERLCLLLDCSHGERKINLSLAVDNKTGKWDEKGISYILKPFYDCYTQASANNKKLIPFIVQDIIQSLHLSIDSQETAKEIKSILNRSFPDEKEYSSFLIDQLILNNNRSSLLKGYLSQEKIKLLEKTQEREKAHFAIRDLLFYYSLKELETRVNYFQHIVNLVEKNQRNLTDITNKPAFLVYTYNEQTTLYVLSVIQEKASSSILAIGQDSDKQESAALLRQILPERTISEGEISSLQLERLKQNYEDKKTFYLFTPLGLADLSLHTQNLPELNIPAIQKVANKRKKTKKSDSPNEETSSKQKAVKLTKKQRLSLPQTSSQSTRNQDSLPIIKRRFDLPNTSTKNILPNDSVFERHSFPSKDKEQISSDEETQVPTKKQKKFNLLPQKNQYQSINSTSIEIRQRTSPPPEDNPGVVGMESTVSLSKPKYSVSVDSTDENILESLINSFCDSAIQRINEVVSFADYLKPEKLKSAVEKIIQRIQTPIEQTQITFEDKQLKTYQQEAIIHNQELSKKELGHAVCHAPGLGKTKTSCGAKRETHKKDPQGRPVLVMVPNSLLPQWEATTLKQEFSLRYDYYIELLACYNELTSGQKEEFAKAIATLSISQYKKMNELLNKKTSLKDDYKKLENDYKKLESISENEKATKEWKKATKKCKKAFKKKLQELKDVEEAKEIIKDRLNQINNLISKAYAHAELASSLLPKFTKALKISKYEELDDDINACLKNYLTLYISHIKENTDIKEAAGLLKHLDFKETNRTIQNQSLQKQEYQPILHHLLRTLSSFPNQQNQCRDFLAALTGIKKDKMASQATKELDESLLKGDMYEQVVTYTSNDRATINYNQKDKNTYWKTVLTTPSALYALKDKPQDLQAIKDIPWGQVIIDEVHEFVWDIGFTNEMDQNFSFDSKVEVKNSKESKKTTLFMRDFLKNIKNILVLTGTPYVNSYSNLLSILQMANPTLDFSPLANLLHKRRVFFNSVLIKALKEKTDTDSLSQPTFILLQSALKSLILAYEQARNIHHYLMDLRLPTDKDIREAWTDPDGTVKIPEGEKVPIDRELTKEQEDCLAKHIDGKSFFADSSNLACVLFHPKILEEWKMKGFNKNKIKDIKEEIQNWTNEEYETFINGSHFLKYLFKENALKKAFEKEKPENVAIFMPQIKFSIILKYLFQKAFKKTVEVTLYNGQKDPHIRAGIVNRFETEDGKAKVIILTPKAGGVGLNLPSIKYLFGLGWFHKAMESQIEHRALRVGKTAVTYLCSFVPKTSYELHKKYIADVKDKAKDAHLSKKSVKETIPLYLEALAFDDLSISLGATIKELEDSLEEKKAERLNILNEVAQDLLADLDNLQSEFYQEIKALEIKMPDPLPKPQPKPVLKSVQPIEQNIKSVKQTKVSPPQTLVLNTKVEQNKPNFRLISPIQTPHTSIENLKRKSLTVNINKATPNLPLLDKMIETKQGVYHLVPLATSSQEEAGKMANRLNSLGNKIPSLLRGLNSLSIDEWTLFIQNPQQFLNTHSKFEFTQLLKEIKENTAEVSSSIRLCTYNKENKTLIEKNHLSIGKNSTPTPRLLELAVGRYAVLIKSADKGKS
jgi:hypothetical protein